MAFRDLLRHSKVLTLPSHSVQKGRNLSAPQQQVLETTQACFHRRNWGLKAPVPKAATSRLLSVSKLDTERGMADLDYNPRFARKIERIEETGFPVQHIDEVVFPQKSTIASSGRDTRKPTVSRLSTKQLRALEREAASKRREFLSGRASGSSPKLGAVEEYLGLGSSASIQAGVDYTSSTGGVGLTYSMPGVLHNTPQGVQESVPVLGRAIPKMGRPSAAQPLAVAGFVATSHAASEALPEGSAVLHEKPRKVELTSLSASRSGKIQIGVRPVSSANSNTTPNENLSQLFKF